MGIGATSPLWRRILLRSLAPIYLRRRCATDDGGFEAYVSGAGRLKLLDPRGLSVEPVHRRFIRDWVEARSIVWDVGAHLGMFALPASLKAKEGRVHAFEPDRDLAAKLECSLRLDCNAGLRVSVHALALADRDGVARFHVSKYSRAMNKLDKAGPWHAQEFRALETRQTETARIDTLARTLEPPSVLKIDVEGAEMRVLEGGADTIARCRPAILIEGPKELWAPMGDFFRRCDYVMLDGAAERPVPLDHPVWDTIAVPRERYAAGRTAPSPISDI
ncbi:MAG TPA: FkbM family methyltransferase [Alphaproteobacteria bacterium]|nr:FkbM family methyltransferase [Alphaproteobacteria bacterium]